MHYQLPQELKTNKLESLPEDLRKMAEEVLANKFDLAEVQSPKPKQQKPKTKPQAYSEQVENMIDDCLHITMYSPSYGKTLRNVFVVDGMPIQEMERRIMYIFRQMAQELHYSYSPVHTYEPIQVDLRYNEIGCRLVDGARIPESFLRELAIRSDRYYRRYRMVPTITPRQYPIGQEYIRKTPGIKFV